MKRCLMLLLIGLLAVLTVQAQFAKPLKKKNDSKRTFCIGITGNYSANDMIYNAVSISAIHPFLAPSFGLVAEWNTMQGFSIGMDISYVIRGDNETFVSEFLTSYSTTTFARIDYCMSLNGIELRVPMTCYFGGEEFLKPYVYVAPRFSFWTGGHSRWERVYDDGSFSPMVFESEVTDAMVSPLDFSVMAGLGLCSRLKMGRRALFCKLDLGYGISMMSNFSQGEVNEEVAFYGWGDIGHEELGKRYLHNIEARLALMVPLQKPVDDACDFNQKPYKRK